MKALGSKPPPDFIDKKKQAGVKNQPVFFCLILRFGAGLIYNFPIYDILYLSFIEFIVLGGNKYELV